MRHGMRDERYKMRDAGCHIQKSGHEERGAIMVVALVLMMALIMMGSLAVMITMTERNISRNHKMAKEAFYLADSGYPLAVKIIHDITQGNMAFYPGFIVEGNLGNEVMDYFKDDTDLNDKDADSPRNAPDIQANLLKQSVRIDIDRTSTTLLYGGSAEFGSGGEGAGFGGSASKKMLFEITSQGRVQGGALSHVIAVYRSIL